MKPSETSQRAMDIHLLSRLEDDGSPFGVEYTTRRWAVDESGGATCDVPGDPLWQELSAGIPGGWPESGARLTPRDGAAFLDAATAYLRYEYLGPLLPLIADHRGPSRPDNFRIEWKALGERPIGGYGFAYRAAAQAEREAGREKLIVAGLATWRFMQEFDHSSETDDGRPRQSVLPGQVRIVEVDLLERDSPRWARVGLDADAVIGETKEFMRVFLRRFFERRAMGIFPETVGEWGSFSWSGLF